jgi:mannonate dehydratase
MLKRKDAINDYSHEQIINAKDLFEKMNNGQKEKLLRTILYGLPGSLEAYTLEEFRTALNEYNEIGEKELRENLNYFIKEIIPVAEQVGVAMGIHPDDPPWSLLGLPRVVGNKHDIRKILDVIDSPSNGITFCTGSFGAGYKNDIVDMAKTFAHRINFVHLRNLTRDSEGNFMEAYHLDGDIDLYGVMKELLLEQQRRIHAGRKDTRLPMRPDHGHLMISEQNKSDIYPGYSLIGRMRGLAELRGMELGIRHSLGI